MNDFESIVEFVLFAKIIIICKIVVVKKLIKKKTLSATTAQREDRFIVVTCN